MCFQYRQETEEFYEHLKRRMEHFGMILEENKSSLIEFGRYAQERYGKKGRKLGTFLFLKFTHYCFHGRNDKFRARKKTSKKKFAKKYREVSCLIQQMRKVPIKEIIKRLNQMFVGYYYYGVVDNYQSMSNFRYRTMKSLYKWLNGKSQKKSYNWKGFSVYVCQILNNKFCKEPRAGKPHAGFCEGHIL